MYRRENGKAEGNLNEETRDNAWAKRPEQNGTLGRGEWRGSILVVRREEKPGRVGGEGEKRMGENNRGIKLDTAAK